MSVSLFLKSRTWRVKQPFKPPNLPISARLYLFSKLTEDSGQCNREFGKNSPIFKAQKKGRGSKFLRENKSNFAISRSTPAGN